MKCTHTPHYTQAVALHAHACTAMHIHWHSMRAVITTNLGGKPPLHAPPHADTLKHTASAISGQHSQQHQCCDARSLLPATPRPVAYAPAHVSMYVPPASHPAIQPDSHPCPCRTPCPLTLTPPPHTPPPDPMPLLHTRSPGLQSLAYAPGLVVALERLQLNYHSLLRCQLWGWHSLRVAVSICWG